MADQTVTYRGSVPALRQFIRDIPAMIAGSKPDSVGLRQGITSNMAFVFFSLVGRAFDVKSKGGRGDDGIEWAPNTKAYLAYEKGRTRSKAREGIRNKGSFRVNREAHLTRKQKLAWTKANNAAIDDIIRELADAGMTADQRVIKGKAAIRAWAATRKAGAASLISTYPIGGDTVLVDEGDLRRSIQPGVLAGGGVAQTYSPSDQGQIFDRQIVDIVVGSRDPKADFHQNSKKLKHGDGQKGTVRRQMWPEEMPERWLDEIVANVSVVIANLPAILASGAP